MVVVQMQQKRHTKAAYILLPCIRAATAALHILASGSRCMRSVFLSPYRFWCFVVKFVKDTLACRM